MLRPAPRVVGGSVALPADPADGTHDSCSRGHITTTRRSDCRCRGFHTGIPRVGGASGILRAPVGVNVQLRRWVELEDAKAVPRANGSERTVRTSSGIRQLRRAEAANAVAIDALAAKSNVLREERNTQAGPASSATA